MNFLKKLSDFRGNKLFKDSFWSIFGNVLGKGLALLSGILVARFLGKDIYGEYGIIKNTVLTIGMFSTFGLGYTSTKFVAELKSQPEKNYLFIKYAHFITIVFSLAISILLFFFSKSISVQLLDNIELDFAIKLLSVITFFNAISTTQTGIIAGFGLFKELARINIWVGVITFLLTILLTYFFLLEGALIALLIVTAINCYINYRLIHKQLILMPANYILKGFKREIIRFSAPIAFQETIYSLSMWLSSVMLIKYASYGELGLYSAAMQWNAIILFIPGILRNVILSHLSSVNVHQSQHQIILKQIILVNFFCTFIPFLIILVFSKMIALSYGQTFVGLSALISIAVFETLFTSVSNVYSQAFISINKQGVMSVLRFIRDGGGLILFYFLITMNYLEGAKALIIANLIVNIVFLSLVMLIYKAIRK